MTQDSNIRSKSYLQDDPYDIDVRITEPDEFDEDFQVVDMEKDLRGTERTTNAMQKLVGYNNDNLEAETGESEMDKLLDEHCMRAGDRSINQTED
tara:strand:- start:143 stop:427 length:285 start_codon:yes stop_codon:yes gene_type:complete